MKKLTITIVAISLVVALRASADTVTVNYVPGYYSAPGGEFNLSAVVGSGYASSVLVDGGFESFCLELNEDVDPWNSSTYNYVVNPYGDAVLGGGNLGAPGPDGGDPISIGTAYLYYEFATGKLTGYDYSTSAANGTFASRAAAAWALQNAIWYLEDENNATYTPASELIAGGYYLSIVDGMFTDPEGNANGAYGVGVLNLTTLSGGYAQDQLFLPDGGATAILLGLGLGGIGLVSRKFRRV